MAITKGKNGTYEVRFRVKDENGNVHQVHRRGFKTKKEESQFEIDFSFSFREDSCP